jgi:hypothetical protein
MDWTLREEFVDLGAVWQFDVLLEQSDGAPEEDIREDKERSDRLVEWLYRSRVLEFEAYAGSRVELEMGSVATDLVVVVDLKGKLADSER